jgi:hypothetical protein
VKIAAGLVAVLVILLAMIAAIGNHDGSIAFGDPSTATNPVVSNSDNSPVTGVEVAYLEFVVGTLKTVSNDINTLGMLFSQPAFEDEYWQSAATVVLSRMETSLSAIEPLEPSARLQPFQDASVKALRHSGELARMLRALLVAGTTELTEEAAQELVAAAEAFGESEDLLNAFLDAHPLPEE